MKVSIGSKIIDGPWGGGNLFVKNLSEFLLKNGHDVIYDLSEKNIDLILLTDPRSRKESSSTFNHIEILNYKKKVNKDVVVVQRINECDERKGTNNINKLYLTASNSADHIIFVSSWLRDIYLNLGMNPEKSSVVLAGANKKIFNKDNRETWDGSSKLKLVTHHWSNHENKGFDVYKQLDDLISHKNWKNKLEFTYIGNMNENYKFINSNIFSPLDGRELASVIKKHHIYITASINEPSGNHHIEAAQCGLPIIYRNSGGIPEYCNEYGVELHEDVEQTIDYVFNNYEYLNNKVLNYPNDSEKMCQEFYQIFNNLVIDKGEINKKLQRPIAGTVFILKYKFLKIMRNIIVFNIKKFLYAAVKKGLKNG
jgi:glycosyltransferase involved in cell wall biosynthesis